MGDQDLVPVLLYLFRRIEKRLTGAPSLIILDEAWLMLGHPAFRDKIREWLKVLRKANCAVVLAAQSISDADKSGIMDVLRKVARPRFACRTALRAKAARAISTSASASTIGKSRSSRRQSRSGNITWFRRTASACSAMALGPITLSFVGAAGKDDIKRIEGLHTHYGDEWPRHWLLRGIENAHKLFAS